MNTKLIIVEGLPGFGKSTTACILNDILIEKNILTELILEGNLEHPADYDGVASFTIKEFKSLLVNSGHFKEVFLEKVTIMGSNYLLPYKKIKNEYGANFPDKLFNMIIKNDIYELPFEVNKQLITEKWRKFAEKAENQNLTYIFECCLIQNPVTIGMIKYGENKENVANYVLALSEIIENLNPILIYIDQDDLEFSFKKAVKERSKEWSDGFIDYYTTQGYGKMNGYNGLEGTIKVLEARQDIESEIFNRLKIKKVKINNSLYEPSKYKSMIIENLKFFGI